MNGNETKSKFLRYERNSIISQQAYPVLSTYHSFKGE
jgi:hypothetical protein